MYSYLSKVMVITDRLTLYNENALYDVIYYIDNNEQNKRSIWIFPPTVDIIFLEVEPLKRWCIGSLAETNAVAVHSRRWLISMLLLVGLFYIGNPMREEVIE